MTMTHEHREDRKGRQQLEELRSDKRTADSGTSRFTREGPCRRLRRWSVAERVAAARVADDHSAGA